MKIRKFGVLSLGLLLAGLVSCEYDTIVPKEVVIPDVVSFSTDVEPLFTSAGCTQCHPSMLKPDLAVGKAYASLTSTNLVVAGSAATSKLWSYISSGHQTAANMTAEQKAKIEKWINDGAKNN
jgi:hypothetical protein